MGVSNTRRWINLTGTAVCLPAIWAISPLSGAEKIHDVLDSAGGAASSAFYSETGSIGGISGVSSSATITDRGGYTGQLIETTVLQLGPPQYMNEGATLFLNVSAKQNDDTFTALPASEVSWLVARNPENATITPGGQVLAAFVYQESATVMRVQYSGLTGQVTVVVRDINTDNFGLYTGDGLPDFWQVRHFGINNQLAAPGLDPDADGKDNLNEYLARTLPKNAASVFNPILTGDPDHLRIDFTSAPDRHYNLESSETLDAGTWVIISGPLAGTGGILSFPITPAPGQNRFYRVSVNP